MRGKALSPSPPTPRPKTSTVVHEAHFEKRISGPIPSPEILHGYGEIDKDFPGRTVRMAEQEQSHRHTMERQVLDAECEDRKRDRAEARLGQGFGLIIGLAAIVGGVAAGVMGSQWTGSIIGGGGVIGLVAVFIKGWQQARPAEQPKPK